MIRTFVIGKPKKIMQHLDSKYWRKKVTIHGKNSQMLPEK